MEEFLKVNEVAKRLRVTKKTITKYIREGKLKAIMIGNQYRVFESSLDKLIDKTTRKGSDSSEQDWHTLHQG
ncbi:MAG: helix-turn-helix domain-containing protein [Acholeplasmataceae bacterium]|nr:helix-turn-helix domain-containing protein [Acholeplasmataceae bacterium]